jgi:hypothetical protein
MIEIEIKKEWIEEAKRKAEDLGVLRHSFMKGEGNVIGFLGEIMVSNKLKAKIENTYDYDIIKKGIKIDVKSKRCTSKPKPHYECSVAAYNTKQKCDFYVFVRILDTLDLGWICGIIDKTGFFKKSKLYKKGFCDERNGLIFKEDTYNLEIQYLIDLSKLIKSK